MTHPFLSSAGNFLFGAQPAHITKHYQRYLGEKPFAYGVYAALAVYFAHRLWQVWNHDSNAVVPLNRMERGEEDQQRHCNSGQYGGRSSDGLYEVPLSTLYTCYNQNGSVHTYGGESEYSNDPKTNESFKALWAQEDYKSSQIQELYKRVTAIESHLLQGPSIPFLSTINEEMDPREAKRDGTRRIAGIAGSLLAMTFAANWSLAPVWQVPQLFTILALAGGEFAYYLSPANKGYRDRCQFECADGSLKKFCIGLLHSPFVHSLDQMMGDKLGKLAGIERSCLDF